MKKKVLIVDDDNDILDLFEIFLFEEFQVFTAVNGFDGLNIAKKVKPDCVVTDIMMPVMDGIRFIKRIRKVEGLEGIPVIAATAFSSVLQEKSLEKVGFTSVVSKPISRAVLINTIHEMLGEIDED